MESGNIYKLRNFCLIHPVYLQVLEILERTDDWVEVVRLKQIVGIDPSGKGEGFATWQVFTKLAGKRWGCRFVQTTCDTNLRKSYRVAFIRAIPERENEIKRFLEKVNA